MNVRKILHEDILIEESFRNKSLDLELAYDIKANGLSNPLIVEKQKDGTFILVEGYRRYFALKHIGITKVNCIINTATAPVKRVLKRLKTEFYQKRRTGYEMQRMIEYLLENDLNELEIAKKCNVTRETVRKYMNGLEVNPEWLIAGDRTGAGKHGYTVIHKTKHLKGENKNFIVKRYTDRDINGGQVQKIKNLTEMVPFQELSERAQKETLDSAITYMKNKDEGIKEIVYEQSLRDGYGDSAHRYIFELINRLLDRLLNIFKPTFINHLSFTEKNKVYKKLIELIDSLNMPIRWSEFRDSAHKNNDYEEPENPLDH